MGVESRLAAYLAIATELLRIECDEYADRAHTAEQELRAAREPGHEPQALEDEAGFGEWLGSRLTAQASAVLAAERDERGRARPRRPPRPSSAASGQTSYRTPLWSPQGQFGPYGNKVSRRDGTRGRLDHECIA